MMLLNCILLMGKLQSPMHFSSDIITAILFDSELLIILSQRHREQLILIVAKLLLFTVVEPRSWLLALANGPSRTG